MNYQINSISKKSTIKINNPNVAVKGNLTSIKETDEQEELVSGISMKYKNNLILVFVIVVTFSIVVTGFVLFTAYSL